MIEPAVLDVLLSGAAIGGFAILAVAMALSPQSVAARWVGGVFFLTAMAAVIDDCPAFRPADGGFEVLPRLLASAAPGMFWAFPPILFGDERRVPTSRWAPPILCMALALSATFGPSWSATPIWTVQSLFSIVLVGHALLVIGRGWKDDLVEPRRRLRAPVMAAAGAYVLGVCASDISGARGAVLSSAPLVHACILAALALGGVIALMRVDPVLLGSGGQALAPRARETEPVFDRADQLTLSRLDRAMDEEEIWRREDLSIRTLADHVGAPEHRIRRLINGALGHRNFAAFINNRRIEAAKAALGDLDRARAPVSTIAYELGFGSLGPFNRAFKESTGMTPTAWRQAELNKTSPNSEKPRSNRKSASNS